MVQENDPDYTNDDPAFAPEAFKWERSVEIIEEVILVGIPIPMKPSIRGNERMMMVGHSSLRIDLVEVGIEIRKKAWGEDYQWVFHARDASAASRAAFNKRRGAGT